MNSFEEIVAAAKLLSEGDRLHLVDLLLQSIDAIDGEVSDAWAQALARRIHSIDTGEAILIPAEEVSEEARRRLSS